MISREREVVLWNSRQNKTVASLIQLESSYDSGDTLVHAAFSGDGQRLVTASWDGAAKMWDSRTGRLLFTLQHGARMEFVAFSADDRRVVVTSWDGIARIWDSHTGRELAVFHGHKGVVASATFSRDGDRLVTAGWDGTTRVWDSHTGRPLGVLDQHAKKVFQAAFSSDGERIVSVSEDATRLWDVHLETSSPSQMVRFARCRLPFRLEDDKVVPAVPDPGDCNGAE